MTPTLGRLAAVVLVMALVAVACGDDDATTTTRATATTAAGATTSTTDAPDALYGLPVIDPLSVPDGDIGIAGSSTVYPLSLRVVARWIDEGGPEYAIESIGSGGGIERFCVDGQSDIANASRPMKAEEADQCRAIGREPIEIRVGTDALTVVISNGNYFAQDLTIEELAAAFSAPAGSTWDMVNPAFPAHPIKQFSPGTDSGTFDYFNEAVFDEAEPSPILAGGAELIGENDELTVAGVANDGCTEGDLSSVCAIGFFGFAYYQNSAGDLQAVSVDGVAPGVESVNANTYAISRPLFMYTAPSVLADKPAVAMFIAYYLQVVNEEIEGLYFPAPEEALLGAADAIKEAAGW